MLSRVRSDGVRASALTCAAAAKAYADVGAFFEGGLEFNAPAHGTWNIVHIGMLVPEAHQVYVCAVNCMRGVVLTAQEMGAQERFSCVLLREEDVTAGTVEEVTLEGITGVLEKLAARGTQPPCVMVFPVCTHLFLGVSMRRVYDELERRFPEIDFVRAFMDPISRKRLFPDQRLRREMLSPIRALPIARKTAVHVGSDLTLAADADLRQILDGAGWRLRCLQDCETYEEFLSLGAAELVLCTFPGGELGARTLAERLGRRYLYLPATFDAHEIERQERTLSAAVDAPVPDFACERKRCEAALDEARVATEGFDVVIDALAHPRPFGLARLLIEHGLCLTEILAEGPSCPEEEQALARLAEVAPDLVVRSMVAPAMRVLPRTRESKTLAIGQRAAFHTGTSHFVNIVEGGGLWGHSGVREMARLICEAATVERDARDLIPRKGLGCVSMI